MEKKNWFFILVPIFAIFLLSYLYINQSKQVSSADRDKQIKDVTETALGQEETLGTQNKVSEFEDIEEIYAANFQDDPNLRNYKISKGSTVSYTVRKEFLNQQSSNVVGVGDLIIGYAEISKDLQRIKVDASVDIKSVKTDNPKRDSDVMKLFKSTEASMKVDKYLSSPIILDKETTEIVNTEFTLNNITKEIPFTITAILDSNELRAKGQAKVKLSDFGLTPPYLENVFSVPDEIVFSFDIVAL